MVFEFNQISAEFPKLVSGVVVNGLRDHSVDSKTITVKYIILNTELSEQNITHNIVRFLCREWVRERSKAWFEPRVGDSRTESFAKNGSPIEGSVAITLFQRLPDANNKL